MKKLGLLIIFFFCLSFLFLPSVKADTFGVTDIKSGHTPGAGYIRLTNVTFPETMTTISIHAYLSGSGTVRFALYNVTSAFPNQPYNLLGESSLVSVNGEGWYYGNVSLTVDPGYYWIAFQVSSGVDFYYELSSGRNDYKAYTYGLYPQTINVDATSTEAISLFVYCLPYVAPTPTPSPIIPGPQPYNPDNMSLMLYLLILGISLAFAILAFKYWPMLGIIGALLTAIFTYLVFQADYLIIENQLMPMGFFAYVPLALIFLNAGVVLKKKK